MIKHINKMEFIQENQRTLLIILAVVAVLFIAHKNGYFNCGAPKEAYQGNWVVGGRGSTGRGLTAEKLRQLSNKQRNLTL